jgi:hypothetical protein
MNISDHIAAARDVCGANDRLVILHLATQIEGLRAAAQAATSGGFIRARPESVPAPATPDAILAAFERIDGVDDAVD